MYPLKTAFVSMGRNAVMTITSIITITCCLFLFGAFLLLAFNINYIGEQVSSQCELQAYIDENQSPAGEKRILNEISAMENVETAEFESAQQAFENYKAKLGENASALEGMEKEGILRSSVKVTIKDLSLSADTAKKLSAVEGVAKVNNRQDVIRKVIKFTHIINLGSLIAMIILLIASVFIIQNTIKLSVNAREEEIHIMKFVGATDSFIRRPFVIEGVSVGIIGALAAFVLISFGYNALMEKIDILTGLFDIYSYSEVVIPAAASLLVLGMVMGALGSKSAVKRHLNV